jgi:hypothetical protein
MIRKYIIITEFNSDTIIHISVEKSNKLKPSYYNKGGTVNGLKYEIHDYSLNDAIAQLYPDWKEREPEFNYEG